MGSLRFLVTIFNSALALLQRLGYSPQDLVREAQAVMRDYRSREAAPVLTSDSTRVLSIALEESEALGDRAVRPVHILLGLVREEFGVAGRLLRDEDFSPSAMRQAIKIFPDQTTSGPTGLSDSTQEVLRFALQASQRLGAPSVDTEHLLLGVLSAEDPQIQTLLDELSISEETLKSASIRAAYEPPPKRIDDLEVDGGAFDQATRVQAIDETLASLAGQLRALRSNLAQDGAGEKTSDDQTLDDQTRALLEALEKYIDFLDDRSALDADR